MTNFGSRKREKQMRVQASVPVFVKAELEKLSQAGSIAESKLISLMIVHALPWAAALVQPIEKDKPKKR